MKKSIFLIFIAVLTLTVSTLAQNSIPAQAKPEPPKTATPAITEITIDVEGGLTLKMKAADLGKLTRVEVKATGHDEVESVYSGYELRTILAPAGAKFGKDLKGAAVGQFLIVEAADGYRAVYSLTDLDSDFADKVVILADMRDGKPLDAKNGPWQVIATNEKKHARWVRQVTALKVKIAK